MNIDNQFIHEHTALVNCIARQYNIPSIPHEDLVQEGFIGLLEAISHFDPNRGVSFRSYAAWWVRKYITEAIRRYGYIVSLPQRAATEHVFTEQLDRVVGSDDGEALTYEDVLRSPELLPDEQIIFQEGLDAWKNEKRLQKTQKKCIAVGKIMQKYVNK